MRMRVSSVGERYGGRGHDDLALAAALAWWRIRRSGLEVSLRDGLCELGPVFCVPISGSGVFPVPE